MLERDMSVSYKSQRGRVERAGPVRPPSIILYVDTVCDPAKYIRPRLILDGRELIKGRHANNF